MFSSVLRCLKVFSGVFKPQTASNSQKDRKGKKFADLEFVPPTS